MVIAENQYHNQQSDWRKDASLRAHNPARQPCRPVERRTKDMVIRLDTAIRNAVEILPQVVGCVKSDGAPQASGPLQEQRKQYPKQPSRNRAHCGLTSIERVPKPKQSG